MAKIYARRIKNEQMTLEEVPLRWREETQNLLDGADATQSEH